MIKIDDINQGDVLSFKANDGNYKALLCTSSNKVKSPHSFTFAALTIDSKEKPGIAQILESSFWGTGLVKNEHYAYSNKALQHMWACHPEIEPCFLGSYGLLIWRKDWIKFSAHVEWITHLNIVEHLDKNGNGSMNASDWNFIKDFFSGNINTIMTNRGQKMFQVKAILNNME